jgi:hypothetical protein
MSTDRKYVYVVNLALAQSSWSPEAYQLVEFPNTNYANSLFIGLLTPVVTLPSRLYQEVVRVALKWHLGLALASLFVRIPLTSLRWAWWGIRGRAFGMQMPPDMIVQSKFLSPFECAVDLASGDGEVIKLMPREERAPLRDI